MVSSAMWNRYKNIILQFEKKWTLIGYVSFRFNFAPKVIISDFESGLIEAVKNQFPGATHSGCHFHF